MKVSQCQFRLFCHCPKTTNFLGIFPDYWNSDCITNFVKISCFAWKFIWWVQFLSHRNPHIFIKVKYLQYQLEILTESEKGKCLLPSYIKNIDGSIDYWFVRKPSGQYRKYCQLKKIDPNKAYGHDVKSIRILKLSGKSVF